MTAIEQARWPAGSVDALVAALARDASLPVRTAAGVSRRSVGAAAGAVGLEAESAVVRAANLSAQLRVAPPAVVELPDGACLALASIGRRGARLLTPDGESVVVAVAELEAQLVEAGADAAPIDAMLDTCGIVGRKRDKARRALMAERAGARPLATVHQLRVHPGFSFIGQLRASGVFEQLAWFLGGKVLAYALLLFGWLSLGQGALSGRIDMPWIYVWAILVLTYMTIRVAAAWLQGVTTVAFGGLLRQRAFAGILNLDADQVRGQGLGQLIGRALEITSIESVLITGGLTSLYAMLDVLLATFVLASGAAPGIHLPLLVGWIALTGWLARGYIARRREWTKARLHITHDLVERMAGHRTRLAQEAPAEWHRAEDQQLETYTRLARAMDARLDVIDTLPRLWMLAGLAALIPAFLVADNAAIPSLAISLGGVILAQRAFARTVFGLAQLSSAWIAWGEVAPLYHAAALEDATRPAGEVEPARPGVAVVEASDLVYRYRATSEAVVRGAELKVFGGDRILLEGSSGGGKSTFAALLAGLRSPSSGLLLAGGLDLATLGPRGWRKRVAAAPQYHENHVISAPLSFNLLMGRRWPPEPSDLDEAAAVCEELGLGPLLERMPGGIHQMVGDTGWQLSQGERSRLYIARALLQGGSLIILDESFAALDPENLRQCLECVLDRAPALVVIAHP